MSATRSPARSVAVVGGGPAGLIAAEQLAAAGLDVTVFDARRSVGRKFLLAGRSGLNVTHSESFEHFLTRYGDTSHVLEQALRAFTPDDLRAWCAGLGEATFVGSSGRIFPRSMKATPLLRSWLRRLADLGVAFELGYQWVGWTAAGALRFSTSGGLAEVDPDATVFALGGASWPRVSSDGSWAKIFGDSGITVNPLTAANCGVRVNWSSMLVDRFAGVPVKNVACRIGDTAHVRGDIVVTSTGFEGGPIYSVGPATRRALATGSAGLTIDTAPDLTVSQLRKRLSNRRRKASATSWLRSAGIAPVTVALAREVTGNDLPDSPEQMAGLLKALTVDLVGLASLDRAISTAGGISFDEVDGNLMLKRRLGTFVAGEMLDWDAPTGGYLLQACFSTGIAAARGVLATEL